ncbi:hypothetical protein BK799_29065 [Rhodococcus sp. D-1]|nr:hypothetical protein BK799_29065 [Rhodococcus sp. D-1]
MPDQLPEGFVADESPSEELIVLSDLGERLSALRQGGAELFFRRRGDNLELVTLTATSPPPTLGQVLPMLQCLDLQIVDRRSQALVRGDGLQCHVVAVGLVSTGRLPAATSQQRVRMDDALHAMWRRDTDVDDFNKLVTHAELTWKDVAVLRTYARYLRQLGQPFSARFASSVLVEHADIATALVDLFRSQVVGATATDGASARREYITQAIQAVPQLDADRFLRALLAVVSATTRTNAADPLVPSRDHPLALKIAPQSVPFAPVPRPLFEIYVLSPDVEGVHLRFGRIARGGLRWSDRSEDLRTEILGLATTQQAKNAVIVPVGAKGGFVLRRPPQDSQARSAAAKHGYETFVSALLDVTDNAEKSALNTPAGDTATEDGQDSYLVVAADKGTATFADTANDIACARGFWLGDAFASGGRAGYDHKEMGITARGAWISAQRHLNEIGIDPDRAPFTAVGVGDMSGDVFGNGMQRSRSIRLIAAFDHRDIFLDPDPDPDASYRERQRLFDTAGSSWQDYDRTRISRGGGVWSRTTKTIELSAEIRRALGLATEATSLTADELIQAILRAPVDMVWNGGIGTYVKASFESHLSVGDKSTDTVRIDADQLRAKVVVEGGNLGLTQAARIQYARNGGRVNTDALDNSAGVDCSDHEVNIKIALSSLSASGTLDLADRDALLHDLEPDVARKVLANNFDHNETLGVSRRNAVELNDVHARQVAILHDLGDLDRTMTGLPSAEEFDAMTRAERGLLSPDLAVLMAHTKLSLKRDLVAEPALDEPEFGEYFVNYFPHRLRSAVATHGRAHPLRREIAATEIINHVVAVAGFSFVHRLREQTGASTLDCVRALRIVSELFGIDDIKHILDTSCMHVDVADNVRLIIRLLLDRCAAVLISRRRLDFSLETTRLKPILQQIGTLVTDESTEPDRILPDPLRTLLCDDGDSNANRIADWIRFARLGPELLNVAYLATTTQCNASEIATVFFDIHRRLRIAELGDAVNRIRMTGSRSHFLARLAIGFEIAEAPVAVTESLLIAGHSSAPLFDGDLGTSHRLQLKEIDSVTAAVISAAEPDIDDLLVLMHRLKGLANLAAAIGSVAADT